MSRIFFISDTHFYHRNVIEYCNRPFKDELEMNRIMIDNWNNTVTDEDTVYFLGDFALRHNVEEVYKDIGKQLKGHILFIRGNHDKSRNIMNRYFNVIEMGSVLEYKGYNFILSHHPLYNAQIPEGFVNIHGHIHDKALSRSQYDLKRHINVSADVINFTPILLDDIIKERLEVWKSE